MPSSKMLSLAGMGHTDQGFTVGKLSWFQLPKITYAKYW